MKQKLFLLFFSIVFIKNTYCSETECTKLLGKIIPHSQLYTTNNWYAKNHRQLNWTYKMATKASKDYAHLTEKIFLFESFNCEQHSKLKKRYKTIHEQIYKKN